MTEHDPAIDGGTEHGLLHESVDAFITDYLAAVVHRRLSRSVAAWCPSWWLHPEAVARVTSLWRAFEHLRHDPALGLSTWWLHHADPHLRALMDPEHGPFAVCNSQDGHNAYELPPLPLSPAPPGYWNHPAFTLNAGEFENTATAVTENLGDVGAPTSTSHRDGPAGRS